jgi:hypothetical protein
MANKLNVLPYLTYLKETQFKSEVLAYTEETIAKVISDNNYTIYNNERNNLADIFNLIYPKIEVAVAPTYIHDNILRMYNALTEDYMDLVKITINYLLDNFINVKADDVIVSRILAEREQIKAKLEKANQRFFQNSARSNYYF